MIESSEFLTEKEERAVRRMEQLTELRRTNTWPDWRAYVSFVCQLGLPIFLFYKSWSQSVITKFSIAMIAIAAMWVALSIMFLFVVPMKRRMDTLAKLLEEEIKRGR